MTTSISSENINTSLICLSLKYINTNYKIICNVSKWIFNELVTIQYNDYKLIRSVNRKDFEIIKSIIKLIVDKEILNKYLIYHCLNKFNNYKLIKLLINNGADIHADNDCILSYAIKNGYASMIRLLEGDKISVYGKIQLSTKFLTIKMN